MCPFLTLQSSLVFKCKTTWIRDDKFRDDVSTRTPIQNVSLSAQPWFGCTLLIFCYETMRSQQTELHNSHLLVLIPHCQRIFFSLNIFCQSPTFLIIHPINTRRAHNNFWLMMIIISCLAFGRSTNITLLKTTPTRNFVYRFIWLIIVS